MSGGKLIWKQIHDRGLAKFEKGQAEHGGDLRRKPVLHELMSEMLDGACYALVLEQQQARALLNLDLALALGGNVFPWEARQLVQNAANLLRFGNEQGEVF